MPSQSCSTRLSFATTKFRQLEGLVIKEGYLLAAARLYPSVQTIYNYMEVGINS